MVLAFFSLLVTMGFVAFSIDTGQIALQKTIMQNAVDSAAMAAAMEITNAIENAPPEEVNLTAYAREQAKSVAANTANLNSVFVDPSVDVEFGLRAFNPATEQFEIQWGVEPSNAVKVKARRDNDDVTQPDGKLPLLFAGVLGSNKTTLYVEAIAYVESRDIGMVLDFSSSMRRDSLFDWDSVEAYGVAAIEDNLEDIYNAMSPFPMGNMTFAPQGLTVYSPESSNPDDPDAQVTFLYDEVDVVADRAFQEVKLMFIDGTTETIEEHGPTGTFSGTGGNAGKDIDTVWLMFSGLSQPRAKRGKAVGRTVSVTFSADGLSVDIVSDKDLSNVVLEFDDSTHYKFDGLNQGETGTFAGIGENAGKTIVGVWVKSGCNASGDGPGYGERFDSPVTGETSFNDTNENVEAYFGLDQTSYPFPGKPAGRISSTMSDPTAT